MQDIVSRFIDANIRNRSNATFQTTQFIKDETDSAKKQLDEAENKVASFRMQNNGRLPDQLESNLRQLGALQAQVAYLGSQLTRASQEKLQMESNIRIFKDQIAALTKEPVESAAVAQKSEHVVEADREVQTAEAQLTALRQHYKDTYPDVKAASSGWRQPRRSRMSRRRDRRHDDKPVVNQESQAVREVRDLDANIRRYESAIEARDLEMTEFNKELKRTNDAIKGYQGRIETVPLGEKQYADLLRDRDLTKAQYMDLSGKLQHAEIAQEMEGRKQGETLELLDPASLPTTPTEPKRPLIISIGGALGLLLGIVIAGAARGRILPQNLKDVRAYTETILGSVPLWKTISWCAGAAGWRGWMDHGPFGRRGDYGGSVVYYYVTKSFIFGE